MSAMTDASIAAPAPECDSTRGCGPGFVCTSARCESACNQRRCDPNATCSLVAIGPVCTCNAGYIATGNGPTGPICQRDVACAELGCHANAACEVGADQLRRCACNRGYSGDGKSCMPARCPMPTLANGSVTISGDGMPTFNNRATFTCGSGYRAAPGTQSSATCLEDGTWSAMGSCSPIECPSLNAQSPLTVSTSDGNRYMSTATYSCVQGTLSASSPRTCQAGGSWSGSTPRCNYCGDGMVTGTETCDPGPSGTSTWSCDRSACRATKIYQPCASASDCDSGMACFLGACASACISAAVCPAPPTGPDHRGCLTPSGSGNGACIATCTSSNQCAPGLTCNLNSGACAGCGPQAPCPSGQQCVTVGTFSGRCQ